MPTSADRAQGGVRADIARACGMALLAGATDILGFSKLSGLFVSFMSGNTTLLGRALAGGDLPRAAEAFGLIGGFVAGVVAGTMLAAVCGRRQTAVVTGAVAVLLALTELAPEAAVPLLLLAMGALNASMSRVGATTVSLTFVTGSLVRFGQGLALTMVGRRPGWGWALQGVLWLCLLAGAAAEASAQAALGPYAAWPLAALAAVLAAASARRGAA